MWTTRCARSIFESRKSTNPDKKQPDKGAGIARGVRPTAACMCRYGGAAQCLADGVLCLVGLGLWSYPNPLRGLVGGLGPLP